MRQPTPVSRLGSRKDKRLMKNVLKWSAIILGIVLVVGLVASQFLLRTGLANMAMHSGFNGWERMGGHPGPRMMGGFGLFGGWLLLTRFLGQIIILGLVITGVVALVKTLNRPHSQPIQSTEQPPVPAPVQTLACKACGKPLQDNWANCPYCGEKI
jgi:uncharacterized membrane protein